RTPNERSVKEKQHLACSAANPTVEGLLTKRRTVHFHGRYAAQQAGHSAAELRDVLRSEERAQASRLPRVEAVPPQVKVHPLSFNYDGAQFHNQRTHGPRETHAPAGLDLHTDARRPVSHTPNENVSGAGGHAGHQEATVATGEGKASLPRHNLGAIQWTTGLVGDYPTERNRTGGIRNGLNLLRTEAAGGQHERHGEHESACVSCERTSPMRVRCSIHGQFSCLVTRARTCRPGAVA